VNNGAGKGDDRKELEIDEVSQNHGLEGIDPKEAISIEPAAALGEEDDLRDEAEDHNEVGEVRPRDDASIEHDSLGVDPGTDQICEKTEEVACADEDPISSQRDC